MQILLFVISVIIFAITVFDFYGYGLWNVLLTIISIFVMTVAIYYGEPWTWETLFVGACLYSVAVFIKAFEYPGWRRIAADFYVVTFFLPHLAIWWVNKGLNRVSDGKIPVIGPNPVALANYKPEVYGQAARRRRESM